MTYFVHIYFISNIWMTVFFVYLLLSFVYYVYSSEQAGFDYEKQIVQSWTHIIDSFEVGPSLIHNRVYIHTGATFGNVLEVIQIPNQHKRLFWW